MKKLYIKPNIKLISIRPVCIMGTSRLEQHQFGAYGSAREANDRFDWGASDDDDE